jgi:acetylornithine deacetylase/succinyl-diaminopimelate desuccinylase-like protein
VSPGGRNSILAAGRVLAVACIALWVTAGSGLAAPAPAPTPAPAAAAPAHSPTAAPTRGSAPEPSWPAAAAEFRQLLGDLVALDSSNPPGNELAVARHLERLFLREGIPCQVFESDSGRGVRGNLVARLKGSGARRPLLLLGHMDVVGVERARWGSDPFRLSERDGCLYARGVIDDKGMLAAEALTLVWLKRADVALDRDVIFLAEADEESGSGHGVTWMLAAHTEAIAAEYAINEGGTTQLVGGRVGYVGLQTSQKRFVNYTVTATGTPGHSSAPHADNAILALARALPRLAAPCPVRLTPDTRAFLRGIASLQPAAVRASLRDLETPAAAPRAALALQAFDPAMGALVHHTVVPTLVSAGFRSNVIPSTAEATLNARLLPGTDPETVRAELQRRAGDPMIQVTFVRYNRPEAPSARFEGPVVEATRAVAATLFPGAAVLPLMTNGATDSADLRAAGIHAYGMLPFPLTPGDEGREHGDNERLPLASVEPGLRLLYGVTRMVAGR